jgi:hypothetical protein
MTEVAGLFSILFLVYVLQCFSIAPRTSYVFYLDSRLRGRRLRRAVQVGAGQRKLHLQNPFLPLTGAIYVNPFPFKAVLNEKHQLTKLHAASAGDPNSNLKTLCFDKVHRINSHSEKIFVDGELFLSLHSEREAQRTVTFLSRLQNAKPTKCLSVLERRLHNMASSAKVEERLQLYARSAKVLHVACLSLFLFFFLIAPMLSWLLGLGNLWVAFLFYLVFSSVSILALFRRSWRALYAEESDGYLQHMITIALSPFAAIRANDALLTALLSDFHPLAVAQRILPEKELLEFAGYELRKAKFLSGDTVLLKFFGSFFSQKGIDLKSLIGAPLQENSAVQSFCPVCLMQYVVATGVCQDCDSIQLCSFVESGKILL